jgi:N-acetylglucosamine malate deacetylase 1
MKLDVLAFAAHPDDAELSCIGTLMACKAQGKTIGIVDLTRGELGTRGTAATRLQESEAATAIIGVDIRHNLGFRDGFFVNDESHQLEVIKHIRRYRPDIILVNAIEDRHPDHGKGADLLRTSSFLSGLRKIETQLDGLNQEPWRPKHVFHYIQDRYIEPDFIFDITPYFERKMLAIKAFKTQFYDPSSPEPASYISGENYLKFVESRNREWGHKIGVTFGEGFTTERKIGVTNLDVFL